MLLFYFTDNSSSVIRGQMLLLMLSKLLANSPVLVRFKCVLYLQLIINIKLNWYTCKKG